VVGVAIAIALLVVATGLAVGLATQTTVYGDNVDYWIVPEDGGDTSALVATDGPQFADAHATTAQIESIDGVSYATPVLSSVQFIRGPETDARVLMIGIIPREGMGRISGVSPAALSVTDPTTAAEHEWYGDAVLSSSAATQLGVTDPATGEGTDAATITTNGEAFTVRAIDDSGVTSDLPVAVVHLSDLQQVTGADEFDTTDQFLVSTTTASVQSELEAIHPQSAVDTRADLTARQIAETDTALAMALGAFIISVVIGSLFVIMTAGLELTTDRASMALLSAVGVSDRSRLVYVGSYTVLVVCLGGVVGAVGGLGGLVLINAVVSRTVLSISVASVHPALAVYGFAASVLIGVLTLPYLRYLLGRIHPEAVME
jgi:putative ABC transport system permease protein